MSVGQPPPSPDTDSDRRDMQRPTELFHTRRMCESLRNPEGFLPLKLLLKLRLHLQLINLLNREHDGAPRTWGTSFQAKEAMHV